MATCMSPGRLMMETFAAVPFRVKWRKMPPVAHSASPRSIGGRKYSTHSFQHFCESFLCVHSIQREPVKSQGDRATSRHACTLLLLFLASFSSFPRLNRFFGRCCGSYGPSARPFVAVCLKGPRLTSRHCATSGTGIRPGTMATSDRRRRRRPVRPPSWRTVCSAL